jgi:hypothetical protein
MTNIVSRGIPNRKKVKRVTINALFMATFLSFCVFFHYQCTAAPGWIPFCVQPIFGMGAIHHGNSDYTISILSASHAWETELGHYWARHPKQKACRGIQQAFYLKQPKSYGLMIPFRMA